MSITFEIVKFKKPTKDDLGFPKEAVSNGDVRIIKSNSRYITISYGDKSKEIEKGRLEK